MDGMKNVMKEFRKASQNIQIDDLRMLKRFGLLTPVLKKILEEDEILLSQTSYVERGG